MLEVPAYRELLLHESRRPRCKNADIMADVYDTPRWEKVVGAATSPHLTRIVLQLCVDGIPAFNKKERLSVKPIQYFIWSLAPWLRYLARHMLVQMLLPAHLKGEAAAKYYDFLADYEMNDLRTHGIDGVKVIVYGDTLDAPGRRELLNMQAVTSFYLCPHCVHTCEPGLRKQVVGGFRRFLTPNSPWRQRRFTFAGCEYMFRSTETRSPPAARTSLNVAVMAAVATRINQPCRGHKGNSMLHKWVGVDVEGACCDVMHDEKTIAEMLLKGLVGKGANGMYKSWDNDGKHRDDCEVFDIFPDFYKGISPLPPWRLSRAAVQTLDMRIKSMWWPHYEDMLLQKNGSFWKQSDTMWKCSQKRYILEVLLPTCLHGFVPAVHNAILMFVYALRRLHGKCISVSEAIALGVLPGSRVIDKTEIANFGRELKLGLVMLEGSFPVAHINPNTHHTVHYGDQTCSLGLLEWFSMASFERNNKRVKDLVRNPGQPLSSLAKNIQLDIAARLISYSERREDEFEVGAPPACTLTDKIHFIPLSSCERRDLAILGVTSFRGVRSFRVARILGVHFRAGEWGRRRCGSVITCIHAGISRYCIVERFLRVQDKSFARVTWLSKPRYPHAPNKLVVLVRVLRRCRHSCVLACDRIEPTNVAVIPHPDGDRFFMMRKKGYDRDIRRRP